MGERVQRLETLNSRQSPLLASYPPNRLPSHYHTRSIGPLPKQLPLYALGDADYWAKKAKICLNPKKDAILSCLSPYPASPTPPGDKLRVMLQNVNLVSE